MADNVGYTPGTGALVAADEIAGVLHQRVKIGVGADGTAVDVSTANPMPITAPSGVSISGTVTVDTGLAQPLTDAQLRATAVPISGTVTANTGLSQPLTDAQLRASAVPISGTVTANTGLTQPLTDAQLRATPVSVAEFDPSTATSFGPIVAANTALFSAIDAAGERSIVLQLSGLWSGGINLQASQNGTDWFDAPGISQSNEVTSVSTVYAADVIIVPVIARFFRAITTVDFVGTVSGSYSQRAFEVAPFYQKSVLTDVDPQVSMPVGGVTPSGYIRRIAVADNGGVTPADGVVITGTRLGTQVGPIVQLETTGYGTVVLQLAGTFTGTVTFQVSNDGSTWVSAVAWPAAGAAVPVNTATAVGQWLIPASGRFFRAQITTAGTGQPLAVAVLKNFSSAFPTNTPSQNMAQIAGTAAVTAGVAGMLAVGGNIAEDTAATSNPLICGGVARTALPASTVVAGDAIRQTFSVSGQMITKENAPGDLDFYVNATVTTNTQTAIRAAQASPIRQNITGLTFQNTNATATTLTIQDGATTLITFSVPASMTLPVQLNFPTPLRGTAATALNYTAGTTGANILLNVIGFNSY